MSNLRISVAEDRGLIINVYFRKTKAENMETTTERIPDQVKE